MQKRGLFITFEGPDGSGKSTILTMLYDALKHENPSINIVTTREPGGKNNIIAEDIRNILLNKIEYKITSRTEALLFAASRAQHVHDFIQPHLANGDLVLCDRYIHSSLVYQGYARGLGMQSIWDINQFAIADTLPDLTIVLMVNPEQGLERIKANSLRDFNRLDQEKLSLHTKVYEGYRKILDDSNKSNIKEIDASKEIAVVFAEVFKVVNAFIKDRYNA